jgi:DNA-directed RNA polymerase specialized sigma24 family protein
MVRSPYGEKEIRAMIETYEVLRAQANTSPRGMRALISIADLDRALARLEKKHWEVVLLHGLIGVPQEGTAQLLHVSQQAVSKRYRKGLEDTLFYINGGT